MAKNLMMIRRHCMYNTHKVLVGKPKAKRPLRRFGFRGVRR